MRLLLVDNYDSYTHNLAHLIAMVTGFEPLVLMHDDPALFALDLSRVAGAVISPGPGHPGVARDVGGSHRLLACHSLPVLGVCLGHQLLALAAGAQVQRAPQPRHGHVTRVLHCGDDLFAGLPQQFRAVRYHSLSVQMPLPSALQGLAWAEDGVLMALRHRERPHYGVQFHPESISTEHGAQLLRNFIADHVAGRPASALSPPGPQLQVPRSSPATEAPDEGMPAPVVQVHFRKLPRCLNAEQVHAALIAQHAHSFWLDSARAESGLSRFSFLGVAGEVLTYRCGSGTVRVQCGEQTRGEEGDIWRALRRRLERRVSGAEALPFMLCGGYVGYFGYELKAELGGRAAHRSEHPDALFMQADRFVAFDHLQDATYLVAVAPEGQADAADEWIEEVSRRLSHLPALDEPSVQPVDVSGLAAQGRLGRARYEQAIAQVHAYLLAGESYELCLTNRFDLPAPADEWAYYRRLRRLNRAPYGALLRAPGLTVHCSSPERFLHVSRTGAVETRPIKGTAKRHEAPLRDAELRAHLAADEKARAENLMICDLLRNDLSRVCVPGSVSVPSFMAVESYSTMHQLVSTVAGTLRPGLSALHAVRACFPGGSMTGAPKLRTMALIDDLEADARGIYSGALGYLTYDGAADLNVVIRTAVSDGSRLRIGAGGAIVLASDPVAEYEEMLLKAAATARALLRDV